MNAEQIIEKIIALVDDPDWEDTETILGFANSAQKRLADNLYLPDLEDGFDTVLTEVDLREVDLPDTYHKGLYLAQVGGVGINVHLDIMSMNTTLSGISMDEDDVNDVCARSSGRLLYQGVPAEAQTIELFYYRLPVAMTESSSSYPDGARGNEDFEWAIIHDACAEIFNDIEDGLEGSKVNTDKHKAEWQERMGLLDMYSVGLGQAYARRPSQNRRWLGSN